MGRKAYRHGLEGFGDAASALAPIPACRLFMHRTDYVLWIGIMMPIHADYFGATTPQASALVAKPSRVP